MIKSCRGSSSDAFLPRLFLASMTLLLCSPCGGTNNDVSHSGSDWTASKLETPLFNAAVFANSTHAIFEITFLVLIGKLGWFSIGRGTRMSNSKMVIMWPSIGAGGDVQWNKSYRRASGHTLPTLIHDSKAEVIRVDTLENESRESLLSLSYCRPLVLSESDTLERATGQRLVWAMSSTSPRDENGSLKLSFHDQGHGTAILDLSRPSLHNGMPESGESSVIVLTHARKHFSLITVHATFLTFAWVFCAPAAIVMARLLRARSSFNWVRIHWIFQTATIVLTVVGTICASIAVGSGSHCDTFQKRLGFFVVVGMLVQAMEGYVIHLLAQKSPAPKRRIANMLHMASGCALVLVAWLNVIFGIKEWQFLGHGTPASVTSLMGILCSIAIFLYFGMMITVKSNRKNEEKGTQSSEINRKLTQDDPNHFLNPQADWKEH